MTHRKLRELAEALKKARKEGLKKEELDILLEIENILNQEESGFAAAGARQFLRDYLGDDLREHRSAEKEKNSPASSGAKCSVCGRPIDAGNLEILICYNEDGSRAGHVEYLHRYCARELDRLLKGFSRSGKLLISCQLN